MDGRLTACRPREGGIIGKLEQAIPRSRCTEASVRRSSPSLHLSLSLTRLSPSLSPVSRDPFAIFPVRAPFPRKGEEAIPRSAEEGRGSLRSPSSPFALHFRSVARVSPSLSPVSGHPSRRRPRPQHVRCAPVGRGTIKQHVGLWKGKRISANLPFKVEFSAKVEARDNPVKFVAHLKEDEFDYLD